jgi:pimeloyl-ACP methyl ester carboxylesterase
LLILKVLGATVLLLAVGFAVYIRFSVPALQKDAEAAIAAVMAAPVPDPVRGETGFARSDGWSIWYEKITPNQPPRGAVLLIMGIADDALGWPKSFIDALVRAGYEVVRFDNRQTGLSDWTPPRAEGAAYALSHMADDARAVLDALDIDKAHIVGISMGGMIAQEFAAAHPQRTASLVPIMSSGHIEDAALPPVPRSTTRALIRATIKYGLWRTEINKVRLQLAYKTILMGDARYPLNVREVAETFLYNIRHRRGYNLRAISPHQAAVGKSGSRYESLAALEMPSLVVHGVDDPIVPLDHGRKLAASIPGARSLWVEGMGHNLPDHLVPGIVSALVSLFEASGEN